jgi:drug/metabolite transporter (DMT)-like permease
MAYSQKSFAYIFALLAALLWGSTAAVGKLLLADISNIQLLFFTNLFAFIGLFLIVLFQKKLHIIKTYKFKDYLTFSWMSMLGVFLYAFFLYGALELMSAQEAFIINYLWPIMVILFAVIILKEKLSFVKIVSLIASFIGVVVVATKGNLSSFQFDSPLGILLATSGAVVYGLFSVLGKKQNYDKFVSTMFYYLFALIYSSVVILLFSNIPQISLYQLAGFFWLGIFTAGLGFVFWFLALKYGDTAKMSNIIFLTPFISLVYIYFLTGEQILVSSIIGLIIIVSGILLQSAQSKISKIIKN